MQESSKLSPRTDRTLLNIVKNESTKPDRRALAIEALKASRPFYSSLGDDQILTTEKRECLNIGIGRIDKNFPFPTGYYVICANPGAGKGWFALWITRKAYVNNSKKTVYFSLEMTEQLIRTRILQQWSDLTQRQFESGMSVQKAIGMMKLDAITVDLFHSENTKWQTPESFEQKIEFYYLIGYRIFHFDHLHELDGANDTHFNQTVTEKWAKAFQSICKKYKDIWLFVYAQPNGASASKTILRRTDIAGSKAITQKCEFFLSLNRKVVDTETGEVQVDNQDREVILWLDKSRVTSATHIGFKLYFSETGNFQEHPDKFTQQVMEGLA